jgi:lipopolysaccharide export system permease protein
MRPGFSVKRVDRYILSQLFLALVLVTVGLVALIWLTQSLRFIQIIVNHGLSPVAFFKLTALLVPGFVATILPITCFIVVVFVYARLSGDREITVMRSAGMSNLALARPAIALALLVVLFCYGLNILLVPTSLSMFRSYQFEIRNQIAAFLLEPGVFTPVSDDVTVYVQSRGTDNSLQGIIIQDARQPRDPSTILASSGQLVVTADGPMVLLEDGSREQVNPKSGRLEYLTFQRNIINLAGSSRTEAMDMTDSAAAPLPDLFHPNIPLTQAEQSKWLVEAHRRLSAPLTALSFTLIALFAILGGRFRRHGGVLRPVGAVITVTLLVAVGLGVNNFAARSLHLLPLIWVAAIAPGMVAGFLLFLPRRLAPGRA